MLSSVLLVLETRRNLIRLAREGLLQPEQYAACIDCLEEDIELFLLRDLTIDLCGSKVMPALMTPRPLDLVHLRTALWFDSDQKVDRFMTMDSAQKQAAHDYLYWEFYEGSGGAQAVRQGSWKAIRKPGLSCPVELYNLDNDLGEEHSVAGEHPEIVERLVGLMDEAHTPNPSWSFGVED